MIFQDKLGARSQIRSGYDRALRNCPWSSQLWINYLLALERQESEFTKMKGQHSTIRQNIFVFTLLYSVFFKQIILSIQLLYQSFPYHYCIKLCIFFLSYTDPFHLFHSEVADKALTVGFSEASDYLAVWSAYCDYLKRRIDWDKGMLKISNLNQQLFMEVIEVFYP